MLAGWQQRWFEATGPYLRYYKDASRESVLAAIDIRHVRIVVPPKTTQSGIFSLRYEESTGSGSVVLKAGTERIARDWVSSRRHMLNETCFYCSWLQVEYLAQKQEEQRDIAQAKLGVPEVSMEDAKVADGKPVARPRLIFAHPKAKEAPPAGSSEITAVSWTTTRVGALGAVENSINHNVQLCVVQMPNNEREWHVNNFNPQGGHTSLSFSHAMHLMVNPHSCCIFSCPGITLYLKLVGTGFRVVGQAGGGTGELEEIAPASLPMQRGQSLDGRGTRSKGEGAAGDSAVALAMPEAQDSATAQDMDMLTLDDDSKRGNDDIEDRGTGKDKRGRPRKRSSIGGSKEVEVSVGVSAKGSARVLACQNQNQNQVPAGAGAAWDYRFAWEFSFED
jgi:hypothetical protein